MLALKLLIHTGLTALLTPILANPLVPSLEHRQLGSCATTPCADGLCCSEYFYCGTGHLYCQLGSCNGGVGGTCESPLCCSEFGYCGTGDGYCPSSPTTTASASPTSSAPPTNTGLVSEWNQCGGEGWTGGTVCEAPYVCTYYSERWSSCK